MRFKKNILLKRIIIFIFILFSLFISVAIVFVYRSSMNMDLQHIHVISLSAEVDIKTLKTRILIDDFLLKNDSAIFNQLRTNLDTIQSDLKKLNFIFLKEFSRIKNSELEDFNKEYEIISTRLSLFRDYVNDNEKSGDRLLELYSDFYMSYHKFGRHLHRYLFDNTISYERGIFGLLLILFLFNILAGYLIIHLMNKLIISERNLIRKTIEVESRERQRIAADLHDGLGAYLSSLIMQIEVLEKECEGNSILGNKIAFLNKLSRQAIQSVEEIINNLTPSLLSRLGLVKTLGKTIVKINSLNKTQFLIDSQNFNLKLASSMEIMLYRICTELINNALKHSSARNAKITLLNQRNKIQLRYEDNGIGFQHDGSVYENNKTGLYNLAMRIESVGGSYQIDSEPGKGVIIKISLNVN
ncbi:MAG: histidine kinase [Bacteroidales bacterium]|nr:histidine kinase [Bacteroidales bacterium]